MLLLLLERWTGHRRDMRTEHTAVLLLLGAFLAGALLLAYADARQASGTASRVAIVALAVMYPDLYVLMHLAKGQVPMSLVPWSPASATPSSFM